MTRRGTAGKRKSRAGKGEDAGEEEFDVGDLLSEYD